MSYDGALRFSTEVDVSGFNAGMQSLEGELVASGSVMAAAMEAAMAAVSKAITDAAGSAGASGEAFRNAFSGAGTEISAIEGALSGFAASSEEAKKTAEGLKEPLESGAAAWEKSGKAAEGTGGQYSAAGKAIEGLGDSIKGTGEGITAELEKPMIDAAEAAKASAGDIAGAVGGSGVAEAVGGLGAHFDTLISAAGKMNTLVKSAENIKTVSTALKSLNAASDVTKTALEAMGKSSGGVEVLTGSVKKYITASREKAAATAAELSMSMSADGITKTSTILTQMLTGQMGLLTGAKLICTKVQIALNAAWAANPIGVVVAAIALLAAGIGILIAVMGKESDAVKEANARKKELAKRSNELAESMEESAKSHEKNVESIMVNAGAAGVMSDKLFELMNKTKRTAEEEQQLKTVIDQLNESMPGLNLEYDEQTKSLNLTEEAIQSYIQAQEDALVAQAQQERAMELSRELVMQRELLRQYEEELAKLSELGLSKNALEKRTKEFTGKIKAQSDAIGETEEKIGFYIDASSRATDASRLSATAYANSESNLKRLSEQYGISVEAIRGAMEASGQNADEWARSHEEATARMEEGVTKLEGHTKNMFGKIKQESSLTVGQLIANLEANQRAVEGWTDNLGTLRDKAGEMNVLQPLVDHFADLGPEYAGTLQNLVNASDEQLLRLAEAFKNGGVAAVNGIIVPMGAPEIKEVGAGMVTNISAGAEKSDSLASTIKAKIGASITEARNTVEEENVAGIGENIVEGIISGIKSKSGLLSATMKKLIEDAVEAAKKASKIKSPSRVMRDEVGAMIARGMAIGIKENSWEVTKATKQMFDDLKLQLEVGAINEEQYYERLYSYRDAYLESGTKEWWDYTKTIMKYEDDLLKEHEKALEEEKKNIKSIYDDIAKYASGKIEEVIKLQESLAKKMQDYGSLATTVKIKYEGQEIEHKKLGDLQGDIDFLRAYGDELQNVKSRIAEAGFDSETVKDFFSVMANMSLDEGAEFARLLSTAAQEEFVSYISDWAEKQGLADELSKQLYSDEFTEAVDDAAAYMAQELEKAGLEVPEGFFASGELSARNFGSAFLAELDVQMQRIRDRITGFNAWFMPQLSLGAAGAGGYYGGNTSNTTYILNSAGETVAQQLQSAEQYSTVERMRKG